MVEENLRYESSPDTVAWAQVRQLFMAVGWDDRCPSEIEQAFHRGSHQRFVFCDDCLVACGRTMDDGRYYAIICDLVVAPEFQGKGIGSQILAELREACASFEFVTLTAAEGKSEFYVAQGWRKQTSSFIWPKDSEQARVHAE